MSPLRRPDFPENVEEAGPYVFRQKSPLSSLRGLKQALWLLFLKSVEPPGES